MNKKVFITLLILVAGTVGTYFYVNGTQPDDSFVYNEDGEAINPDPNHTHADFAVFINGQKLDFSGAEFMTDLETAEHEHNDDRKTLHLHDNEGEVIHRHKPGKTLAEFFNSIDFTFTTNCLITNKNVEYCTSEAVALRMIVNNQEVDLNPQYVFTDEDQILLSYNRRDYDWSQEWQQVTDDACLYSKTCPEKGTPPVENCIADPEVPCLAPLD